MDFNAFEDVHCNDQALIIFAWLVMIRKLTGLSPNWHALSANVYTWLPHRYSTPLDFVLQI